MSNFRRLTVDQARAEMAQAVADTLADHPGMDADEFYTDLFASVALDWPAGVVAEVARMEIGWVPAPLLAMRPDVARLSRQDAR